MSSSLVGGSGHIVIVIEGWVLGLSLSLPLMDRGDGAPGVVLVAVIDAGVAVVVHHVWVLSLTMGMGVDAMNVNSAESESVSGPAQQGVLTFHGRHCRCSHSSLLSYIKCI